MPAMFLPAVLLAAVSVAPFDQVVAAERAFAADSPVLGLHPSFVAHLAPDATVFQPTPTGGIAAHQGKPPSKGTLSWGPAWAGVAGSGDLAVTSGPWEYRVSGDGAPPPATGWFFSVWKRQADGGWKVRADIGVDCPLGYAAPASVENGLAGPASAVRPAGGHDAAKARGRLNAAETRLLEDAKTGIGAAVAKRSDDATRVYRDGTCPAAGPAGRAILANDTRALVCAAERIELASTGDLGYAYGTCTAGDAKTGYLRVWRRGADGRFFVLADVVLGLPGTP